jgi:hypothetical protein
MAVVVVCPECGATTTPDPDVLKGATVACPRCGKQVPVPETKSTGPPPLPPKPAAAAATAIAAMAGPPPVPPPLPAPAAGGEFEVLDDAEPGDDRRDRDEDDELDEQGRPAVGRRSRYEDEDEDDDRPRSRRDRDDDDEDDLRSRRREREEDEEDEDRPRSRYRDEDVDDEHDHPRSRSRDDVDDEEENRPRRRDRDEDDEEDKDDRRPAARDRDEEDAEDDEDDRRPRSRGRDEEDDEDEAPRRRRDDEDDEDDEPRSAARPDEDEVDDAPRGRRYADDEEDDYDDRPGKPKSRMGLLVLALFGLLLVGAGGAAGVWYFMFREPATTTTVASTNPPPGNPDAGNPDQGNPVVPKGKGIEGKGPPFKGPIGPGGAWKHPPRDIPLQPVRFSGDRKAVTLPGTVTDVCTGGDGRYLFLHCPDDRKLLVFDVQAAEVVKDFPTGGKDARFAAGATKLLLFDGVVRTLQRIDLVTLEKDKEEPLSIPGNIRDISLGSGSRGPALMLTDAPGPWPVQFLDLDTLAPADVGWTAPPPADLPRELRFRASAVGNRWIGLPDGKDAKGAVVVSREGKALSVTSIAKDKALGFAALSHDGNTVYSRFGVFPLRAGPPANPPVDQDSYSIRSDTGRFDVQVRPSTAPDAVQVTLGRLAKGSPPKSIDGVPQPFKSNEPGQPDQLVHYVPDAHALVVIQPALKKATTVKLDPFLPNMNLVGTTSTPPDRFTPGKPFEYPLRVLTNASAVTFAVGGPTGVQVSPNGVVRWAVPPDEARDQVSLLITVMGDGARGTQTIKLYNTAALAPKPTDPKKGPDPKKEPPKSPESKGPIYAVGVKLAQPSAETVPIPPAEIASPHVEVPLPGQARDVCVGGGGRYLIFHVPTARKLFVFDTSTLKIVGHVSLSTDDLLFAAGMDKLVVVYPSDKTIVRYSLSPRPAKDSAPKAEGTPLKTEADDSLETLQRPIFAVMGSATAGPLILGGVPGQNNASKMALTFLDVESFKEVKIDKAEGDFQVTTATAAQLRASADGKTLGLWRTQLVPSGVQIVRLEGNTIKGSYRNDSAGEVTPGPDGQKVYTEQGAYDLDAKSEGQRMLMVPAVRGAGFVTLSGPANGKRSVAVIGSATDKPLASFDNVPGFDGTYDPFERNNPNLALDQRLFWVPDAGVLIVVPPAADRVHVYRVAK